MINLENINIILIIVILYFFYYHTKIPKYMNDYVLDLPKPAQYAGKKATKTTKGSGGGDFSQFKDYQKVNSISYSEAEKYWKKYQKFKKKAESLNTYNNYQYFENAVLSFQKCINHLQSIGVKSKEKKYEDGFKKDDFKRKSILIDISKKTKDLYIKETIVLSELANKINEGWKKKPNLYSKPVFFDLNLPEPIDENLNGNFDYYV